MNYNPSIIMLY